MPLDYVPILLQVALVVGIGGSILLLTHLFGPNKPSPEKLDVYECGVPPLMKSRIRLSVKYYLVAVLFVLFDIEAIFLYPWAIIFKKMLAHGPFIFYEMLSFLLILFAGLVYAWKRGALEWD